MLDPVLLREVEPLELKKLSCVTQVSAFSELKRIIFMVALRLKTLRKYAAFHEILGVMTSQIFEIVGHRVS